MIRLHRLRAENFKVLREVSLVFPDAGSILVEGLNESGKSTLFESIYFALYGRPLVSEGTIESVVRYGAAEAQVELALSVDATELLIERQVRPGRPGRARLLIRRPGGYEEEVTRLSAIVERVVAELGGLDGETLLNSCFVEQKKLQRLESLDAGARRTALLRLLNLESLGQLESRFKLNRQDDQALRTAEARRDLAQLRTRLPELAAEAARVERRLVARRVRETLARAAQLAMTQTERQAHRLTLHCRQAEAESRLARIERLASAASALAELLHIRERRQAEARVAAAARTEVEQLRQLSEIELPRYQRRLAELDAALERASAARRAAQAERSPALAPILAGWVDARAEAERAEQAEQEHDATTSTIDLQRARVTGAHADVTVAGRRRVAAFALALVGTAASAGMLVFDLFPLGLLSLLVATVALLVGLRPARQLSRRRHELTDRQRQLDETQQRALTLAGTIAAFGDGPRERLAAAAQRLTALGAPLPDDLAAGRAALEAAEQRDANSERALAREQQAEFELAQLQRDQGAAERRCQAAAELEVERQAALNDRWTANDCPPAERPASAVIATLIASGQHHLADAEQRLETVLDAPLDPDDLRDARTRLATEREQAAARVGALPRLERDLAAASGRLAAQEADLTSGWTALAEQLANLDYTESYGDPVDLRAALATERRQLDEPGTRAALAGLVEERGKTEADLAHLAADLATARATVADLLGGLDLVADPTDCAAVLAVLPEVDQADLPVEAELDQQRDRLLAELGHLHREGERLEATWGLAGVALDLGACQSQLELAGRERAIKQRATTILTMARTSMVGRVLPTTEQNLRLLLPRLTDQRYHDATLSEDYRLEVWDAEAGRYVAKDIFSGGARDQFSLALRLAFALATLPQEIGTTPGFIFLDEPLSAFDSPRTNALVDLLTTGQIARSFAQIFLISHSRTFDPALFPYYLRMQAGRVAETNLARL